MKLLLVVLAPIVAPGRASLYKLIDGVNVDSREPKQVYQVRADLLAAIGDARSGQGDLSNHLQSQGAPKKPERYSRGAAAAGSGVAF